jgi:hypothetical protein
MPNREDESSKDLTLNPFGKCVDRGKKIYDNQEIIKEYF